MATPYTIYVASKTEIIEDYANLWATIEKYFPNWSIDDRLKIAALVIGTCGSCHNEDSSCQCWNEE